MYKVYLLSPLIGNGQPGNSFRPQISDDYPALGWSDITSREVPDLPGIPDTILIELICTMEQITILENDTNYFIVATEEISDEITQ